jgi:1-acyl-sn-glycerol-3-phosphate acyltransferase
MLTAAVPVPEPRNPDRARIPTYDELLADAREIYSGIRIGRPGRSREYWLTVAAMRTLRLRWAVRMDGGERVAKGPAILIGNHVDAMDPVMSVISAWWRVGAFTKVEAFQGRGAFFFRFMGQIPLRRGDPRATEWAMQMSKHVLAGGAKTALFPEGTRSPDPAKLHKLHKRILIPLLQTNPGVPVHVVTTSYGPPGRMRRIPVTVRVSHALPIDVDTMSPDTIVEMLRETMLQLSGQTYVDRYARDVKARELYRQSGRKTIPTRGRCDR